MSSLSSKNKYYWLFFFVVVVVVVVVAVVEAWTFMRYVKGEIYVERNSITTSASLRANSRRCSEMIGRKDGDDKAGDRYHSGLYANIQTSDDAVDVDAVDVDVDVGTNR